jgi:hypothetical protein
MQLAERDAQCQGMKLLYKGMKKFSRYETNFEGMKKNFRV